MITDFESKTHPSKTRRLRTKLSPFALLGNGQVQSSHSLQCSRTSPPCTPRTRKLEQLQPLWKTHTQGQRKQEMHRWTVELINAEKRKSKKQLNGNNMRPGDLLSWAPCSWRTGSTAAAAPPTDRGQARKKKDENVSECRPQQRQSRKDMHVTHTSATISYLVRYILLYPHLHSSGTSGQPGSHDASFLKNRREAREKGRHAQRQGDSDSERRGRELSPA